MLGDVGIHILDFASYVADQNPVSVHCRLKTFGKAEGDRIGALRARRQRQLRHVARVRRRRDRRRAREPLDDRLRERA